jgi:hypothetical protein
LFEICLRPTLDLRPSRKQSLLRELFRLNKVFEAQKILG